MSQGLTDNTACAVCPYCALLCDDLVLAQGSDQSFTVNGAGCRRAAAAFARAPVAAEPLIDGKPAVLEAAIVAAARLLKRARRPLFGGLATDIDGIRASVDLAERCGATLDHLHGDTLAATARIQQTRGWFATTLSEVRNRADLVVVVDIDFAQHFERFPQRCLGPRPAFDSGGVQPRHIAFVGARAHLGTALDAQTVVSCNSARIAEVLRALLARLRGHPLAARRPGGATLAALDQLAAQMRGAAYTAIVFAPGSLGPACEPAIGAVCELVDELNRTTRAALLALGGDNGGQSAASTCAWLTGFPLRVGFGATLHYEPLAYATDTLLDAEAIDALLWIDAYGSHTAPPKRAPLARTIVLGAARPDIVKRCAVFIPVGTPGVDHFARLIRTDSVVTLPLPQQRDSGLPSVAGVLTRIVEKL